MGVTINGREIIEADIGKFLVFKKAHNENYLPAGFKAKIVKVLSKEIHLLDKENNEASLSYIDQDDLDYSIIEFGEGFSDDTSVVESTLELRQTVAADIRALTERLADVKVQAELYGMVVLADGTSSYTAPTEKY